MSIFLSCDDHYSQICIRQSSVKSDNLVVEMFKYSPQIICMFIENIFGNTFCDGSGFSQACMYADFLIMAFLVIISHSSWLLISVGVNIVRVISNNLVYE